MKEKRSVGSWLLWGVYTVPVMALFGLYLYREASNLNLTQTWQLVLGVAIMAVVILFACCTISYDISMLGHRQKKTEPDNVLRRKKRKRILWEAVGVFFLFAVGITFRVLYLLQDFLRPDGNLDLLHKAQITVENAELTSYGSDLFSNIMFYLLRTVMQIFGNFDLACMAVILVIQSVILLLAFFLVRNLYGVLPAVTAAAFFMLFPESIYAVRLIDGEWIALLILTGILFFVSFFLRDGKAGEKKEHGLCFLLVPVVVSGLLLGLLSGMEYFYLSAVFFLLGAILVLPACYFEKTERSIRYKAISCSALLLSVIAGTAIEGLLFGFSFSFEIPAVAKLKETMFPYGEGKLLSILIMILIVSWIVEFFRVKSGKIYPAFLFALAAILITVFHVGTVMQNYSVFLICCILAAANMRMYLLQLERVPEKITDTKQKQTEPAPEPVILPLEEIVKTEPAPIPEPTSEPTPEVRMLHNPLPVPKKHVRKELNYAVEVTEDQMHFDVELDDMNSDYDI